MEEGEDPDVVDEGDEEEALEEQDGEDPAGEDEVEPAGRAATYMMGFDEDAFYPAGGAEHVSVVRELAVEPMRLGGPGVVEPLPVEKTRPGFNCVVLVWLGLKEAPFRVTLDTGASRSLARGTFVQQMMKAKGTRDRVLRRYRGDRVIRCEGVVAGMETDPIETSAVLRLTWGCVGSARRVECDVHFGGLSHCADIVIIGGPQLAEWGFSLSTDADGFTWVEFTKLGVSLLAEGVRFGGPPQRLRAQRPTVI
ncbi:MAG: hypothetical protein GY772_22880, partial [bacterium]|nr:hypothetical protein [bacterium]